MVQDSWSPFRFFGAILSYFSFYLSDRFFSWFSWAPILACLYNAEIPRDPVLGYLLLTLSAEMSAPPQWWVGGWVRYLIPAWLKGRRSTSPESGGCHYQEKWTGRAEQTKTTKVSHITCKSFLVIVIFHEELPFWKLSGFREKESWLRGN